MSHQQRRIDDWTRDFKPRDSIQATLVIDAAKLSIKLDELREVEAAANAYEGRVGSERLRHERLETASDLGYELILPATGSWNGYEKGGSGRPVQIAPRDPSLLVVLLEATREGCTWMADRWAELRKILDDKTTWGYGDKNRATRLLGKDSAMEEDDDVRTLRLATDAMRERSFTRLVEPTEEEIDPPTSTPTLDEARAMIRPICDRQIERLRTRAVEREKLLTEHDARHKFDVTPAGKQLRQEVSRTHRALMKTLSTLMEMQKLAAREEEKRKRAESPSPLGCPTGVSDPRELGRSDTPVGQVGQGVENGSISDVRRATDDDVRRGSPDPAETADRMSPVSRETSDKSVGPTEHVRRGSPDPAETAEASDKSVGPTERAVSRETSDKSVAYTDRWRDEPRTASARRDSRREDPQSQGERGVSTPCLPDKLKTEG